MAGTASAVKTPDTGNKWLDSIMWGRQWTSGAAEGDATEVTYYIAGTNGEETITLDDGSITAFVPYAAETQAMLSAMDAMSSVANIAFTGTTSQATTDLIWGSVDNKDGQDSLGWATPPGTAYSSTYQDHQSGIAINREKYDPDSTDANFLVAGSYDYITFIHELGHALGLAHPHDKGGGSLIAPGVKGDGSSGNHGLSQGIYTMMSYVDGWQTGPVAPGADKTYGYEKGPMAFDIAALQIMYGANMSYHADDDSYVLPTANVAGTGYLCLWDAGGHDELVGGDFGNQIDLRAATLRTAPGGGGWVSYADGIAGGFTIANGVVIEDATGGAGADLLRGNNAANTLTGVAGFDKLFGLKGNDILIGGNGNDRLKGGWGDDSLTGGSGADQLRGDFGRDTFTFLAVSDSATGAEDKILDFQRGIDTIDVSAIDAVAGDTDDGFTLDIDGVFAVGEIRQSVDGKTVILEFNTEGDETAEMTIEVSGKGALSIDDFVM